MKCKQCGIVISSFDTAKDHSCFIENDIYMDENSDLFAPNIGEKNVTQKQSAKTF